MKLYAIRDNKADFFLPILEASNDMHAERIVADTIARGQMELAQHPQDYDLFCLGEYDNQSGEIQSDLPQHVTSITALMEKFFKRPEQQDIEDPVDQNEVT